MSFFKKTITIFLFVLPLYANSAEKEFLLENEKNTIAIFKQYAKSVVNITNIQIARRGFFFDSDHEEIPRGAGSGFVWDKEGHIVTNYHVVHEGDTFLISFKNDDKQYKAKLIGGEPNKDLAVLKLITRPKNLTPVIAGDSSKLQVGQKALAIGNPFGLDHTITTGIVSALGRKIPGFGGIKIYSMIQTDSSINPGNSGGVLLNSSGKLIGMNTMIYSSSGSSAGVGFAVPANTIKKLVPQLIKYGKIIRPALGVALLDERYQRYFKVKKGIVLKSVKNGGAADKAGLKGMERDRRGEYYIGDVIIGIDDKPINSFDDIYNTLDQYKIGDKIVVKYIRKNKEKKTTLILEKLGR